MLQPQMLPLCPHCGQADAVRPVIEVFSGIPSVAAAAPDAQGPALLPVADAIRQQLAPPAGLALPQKSDFPASKYRQTSPETSRSFGSKVDTVLIIGWLVLTFIAYVLVSQIDGDLVECLGTAIALALILIIFGFRQTVLKNLPIAGLREYYRRDAQETADAEQRATQAYQAALAAYEQSRSTADKWRSLLYCARCNGVFAPQEQTFVPIAGLQSYLAQTPGPEAPPENRVTPAPAAG